MPLPGQMVIPFDVTKLRLLLSGWPPSCRNKIPRLFTDQFQFFTPVLRPVCLLAADKWQIPLTSSLKCTSLILQMKQIKSLNSFLAQNALKLTSFHNFERAKQARENINSFFTFQVVKIPATIHILGQNYEIPRLSWYLKFLWPICKIPTFPWPWRKIKFPWLFPDQWPPCLLFVWSFTAQSTVKVTLSPSVHDNTIPGQAWTF